MAKYKIFWTITAENDLEEIIEYISQESITNAIKQYERIKEQGKKLENYPEIGRIIPELLSQNIKKYRELIIDPWRMMYKREKENIYIMAIIDGRRNIEDILLKRQIR